MHPNQRPLMIAAVLMFSALFSALPLNAQTVDPSGHWEGAALVQSRQLAFQIDVARTPGGAFAGTLTVPAQKLTGLPLRVAVDGTTIRLEARGDQPLTGTLSEDGKTMKGEFAAAGHAFPFSLTRTGDAHDTARPTSPPVSQALAGAWNGRLDADGGLRLVLTMTNRADGTSIGSIVNVDQGGLEIPVTIAQDGTRVTLTAAAINGSYSATLNADGTQLAGTFIENGQPMPLTFTRANEKP